jgi:hypothetical protein
MYQFLLDSLTDTARTRVSLQRDLYQVDGTVDGPCFLKVILLTFYVETNATNFHLRQKLHNLPSKMTDLNSDVAAFNTYVRETVTDLASGGQTSTDLLVYLFSAYQTVEDHAFRMFIDRKKEDHDDGRGSITMQSLMIDADAKYNQLTQAKTWKTPTHDVQSVFALAALLKASTKQLKQLSRTDNNDDSSKATTWTGNDTFSTQDDMKQNGLQLRYPAWRFERNKRATKLTKDNKIYYWCDTLNMWAAHAPKNCCFTKNATKADAGGNSDPN